MDRLRRATISREQLAQLKNLEKLQLGHIADDVNNIDYWDMDANARYRYVDPKFQLTCLEMSLASGLHLLAGLKELRELNVARMIHRIGIR